MGQFTSQGANPMMMQMLQQIFAQGRPQMQQPMQRPMQAPLPGDVGMGGGMGGTRHFGGNGQFLGVTPGASMAEVAAMVNGTGWPTQGQVVQQPQMPAFDPRQMLGGGQGFTMPGQMPTLGHQPPMNMPGPTNTLGQMQMSDPRQMQPAASFVGQAAPENKVLMGNAGTNPFKLPKLPKFGEL